MDSNQIARQIAADVAQDFIRRTEHHVIRRHEVATNLELIEVGNKDGSGAVHWQIMHTPGTLCYTGDMGDFIAKRHNTDMVYFCSRNGENLPYLAEKISSGKTEEFNAKYAAGRLRERFEDHFEDGEQSLRFYRDQKEELDELIDQFTNGELGDEQAIYSAIHDSDHLGEIIGMDEQPSLLVYSYKFHWFGLAMIRTAELLQQKDQQKALEHLLTNKQKGRHEQTNQMDSDAIRQMP